MDICLVYKEEYPWDVRVEKMALTLNAQGHRVTIVARNSRGNAGEDWQGSIRIRRLPRLAGWPAILRRIIGARFFLNPVWLWTIAAATRGAQDSVVVVRDLPLVGAGWIIARLRGGKVVLDMAECYPEMYRTMREHPVGAGWARFLKSPRLASLYERVACRLVDHIFVVVEESRDRLMARGVPTEKITIVSNTPMLDGVVATPRTYLGEQLRIIYVGFVTGIRGLDLLVRSASRFLELTGERDSIRVDIVGEGSAREGVAQLVIDLGLQDQIHVHGWQDHAVVRDLMRDANIGALTYRVCGHWNHTIPNKIFDYMQAGLPVLATDVKPIARVLRECNAGVIAEDTNVEALTQRLLSLRDAATREILGRNGQAAIESRYNWGADGSRLIAALQHLSESTRRGSR